MTHIEDTKADIAAGKMPTGHRTIFYDLLTNPELPEKEKETERLRTEAQSILVAGTVTAAHILTNLSFHIINNPQVEAKLRAELKTMWPQNNEPKWQDLNQLEYLVGLSAWRGSLILVDTISVCRHQRGAPHLLWRSPPYATHRSR